VIRKTVLFSIGAVVAGLAQPVVADDDDVERLVGIYADFIHRLHNDPAWSSGGLYHDDEDWGVPAPWMGSWYDVSIGPNLALFNHVTNRASDVEVGDNQYSVAVPTPVHPDGSAYSIDEAMQRARRATSCSA